MQPDLKPKLAHSHFYESVMSKAGPFGSVLSRDPDQLRAAAYVTRALVHFKFS